MEKKLFQTYLLLIGVFSSLYFVSNRYIIILIFSAIPFLLLLSFRYCFLCIQNLPSVSFKNFWFISGLILIVSTSLFDNSITLIKSPDLSREANIFAVVMLRHHVPVNLVITLFMIFQFMMVVFLTLFWVLSYKSLPVIIQDLKNHTTWQKILKIHGIKKFTLRKLFFSMDNPFYCNASLGMSMMGICIYRIYCCLEWLELVPITSCIISIIPIIVFNGAYVTYLLYHSRSDNYVNDKLVDI